MGRVRDGLNALTQITPLPNLLNVRITKAAIRALDLADDAARDERYRRSCRKLREVAVALKFFMRDLNDPVVRRRLSPTLRNALHTSADATMRDDLGLRELIKKLERAAEAECRKNGGTNCHEHED